MHEPEETDVYVFILKDSEFCIDFNRHKSYHFSYIGCMKLLDPCRLVSRRMWDWVTRSNIINGCIVEIGHEDIDHFLEPEHFDLQVAMAFYTLLRNCVGTDSKGLLNENPVKFLVSW